MLQACGRLRSTLIPLRYWLLRQCGYSTRAVATGPGEEYVRGWRKHFRRGYPGILGRLGNFNCHFFLAKSAHDVGKTNFCNPTDIRVSSHRWVGGQSFDWPNYSTTTRGAQFGT